MSTASSGQSRNSAGAAAQEHIDRLVDEVQKIQSDMKTMAAKVGRLAGDSLDRAQEGAAEGVHQAEQAVQRNPLTAIALAVGFGDSLADAFVFVSPDAQRHVVPAQSMIHDHIADLLQLFFRVFSQLYAAVDDRIRKLGFPVAQDAFQ